jgi:hypothetical protein
MTMECQSITTVNCSITLGPGGYMVAAWYPDMFSNFSSMKNKYKMSITQQPLKLKIKYVAL